MVQSELVVAPVLVVLLSCFLASEVGSHTLFLALTLCPFVGFLAFPLVAFSALLIGLHATLPHSNGYVLSPLPYSLVESHLPERRPESSAPPQPTPPPTTTT